MSEKPAVENQPLVQQPPGDCQEDSSIFPASRRQFLQGWGGSFSWLAALLINQQTAVSQPAPERPIDPLRPNASHPPHFRARAKSVIVLFMVGGPASMDTFDYKPLLQQMDGQPLPSSAQC